VSRIKKIMMIYLHISSKALLVAMEIFCYQIREMETKNSGRAFILLLWLCVTVITGVCLSLDVWPTFHPYWALFTLPLIGGLQFLKGSSTPVVERYGIVLGIVLAAGTGLGVKMGIFPSLFHQLIIWPVTIFFAGLAIQKI
jgi:hypothetical protein